MNAPDERGQWTSASAAEADLACPGRHLAQLGIPEEETSEDAAAGNRIHAWLEGNRLTLLDDPDEQDTADKCGELEERLVEKVFGADWNKVITEREARMWFPFGALKHSGKPDAVHILEDAALVVDFKTGRNEVTESASNLQMRDLAVLAARNYGVKTVHVAIIQPWASMKPEVVTYTLDDLIASMSETEARVVASNNPESPRVAGAVQCQYCRARPQCAAFASASVPVDDLATMTPERMVEGIRALSGKRIGQFLALVRLADDTATSEIRTRLEQGGAVVGWSLKDGRETEKITNAQIVFNRALEAGISQDQFVGQCVTVGKTALKAALKAATGAKGKDLDGRLDTLIEGATETETSKQILSQD